LNESVSVSEEQIANLIEELEECLKNTSFEAGDTEVGTRTKLMICHVSMRWILKSLWELLIEEKEVKNVNNK